MGSTPNVSAPSTTTTTIHPGDPQSQYVTSMPSSSTAPNTFVYADKPSTSKITSTSTTIEPQRPYQIQTLADLRSGSLPPNDETDGSGKKQNRKEDGGAKTEPETEDTDYSSSGNFLKYNFYYSLALDQYEVHRKGGQSIVPSVQQPQYNVLLSNPLHNLTSYFHMQPAVSAANPALVSVQPTAMPHQQPTTSVSSSIMPKPHPPIQHHHTHPKLAVKEESPEPPPRQRTESHHQMSRSSPQRQLSPKVS